MAEFVQGYRDVYGKLHDTEEAADNVDKQFKCYQELSKLILHRIPLVKYPRLDDIIEYIWFNYEQIKMIMERYGR